jgi:Family of unknown function (DUF5302)
MINDRKIEVAQGISKDDPKAKMLAALSKKQKNQNTGKSSGPTGGSKVGAGQTAGAAPKMHRRKAGSA